MSYLNLRKPGWAADWQAPTAAFLPGPVMPGLYGPPSPRDMAVARQLMSGLGDYGKLGYIGVLNHLSGEGGVVPQDQIDIDKVEKEPVKVAPETQELTAAKIAAIEKQAAELMKGMHPAVLQELEKMSLNVFGTIEDKAKDVAMKQAAVQTGIMIALMCIPIAGWIAAAIMAVISALMSLASAHYQRKAQEVVANAQQEAQIMEVLFNKKLSDLQRDAIEQEKMAAIKLAISGVPLDVATSPKSQPTPAPADAPPQQGTDGLGFFHLAAAWMAQAGAAVQAAAVQAAGAAQHGAANVAKQAQHAQENVAKDAQHAQRKLEEDLGLRERKSNSLKDKAKRHVKKVGGTIEKIGKKIIDKHVEIHKTLSGAAILDAAKSASQQFLNEARIKQIIHFNNQADKINNPTFRANLRIQLARQLRSHPQIGKMIADLQAMRQNLEQVKQAPRITPAPKVEVPTVRQVVAPSTQQTVPTGAKLGIGAGALLLLTSLLGD